VYLVQVSLLLIGQQALGHTVQHQPLLVQYKQQANPLLSMHNYTPLVISGNDKNKKLTLQY
jgi:hypothetical protein